MNHRIGGIVFALAVGLAASWYAYRWITDPQPGMQRQREEAIVLSARAALREALREGIEPAVELEIVDPLQPNRVAGRVYIYPSADGWDVSGHYRRGSAGVWRPWLMRLDPGGAMLSLAVRDPDPALRARAEDDPRLSVDSSPD